MALYPPIKQTIFITCYPISGSSFDIQLPASFTLADVKNAIAEKKHSETHETQNEGFDPDEWVIEIFNPSPEATDQTAPIPEKITDHMFTGVKKIKFRRYPSAVCDQLKRCVLHGESRDNL